MHKICLETYNDLIKMLFCFFVYLVDSIRIIEIANYNYMYVTMQSQQPT